VCSGSAPANNLAVIGEVHAGSSARGGEVFYSLRFVVVRGSSFRSRLLRASPFCFLVVTCTCTTLVLSWPISVPCVEVMPVCFSFFYHLFECYSVVHCLSCYWVDDASLFHFSHLYVLSISLTVGRLRGRV